MKRLISLTLLMLLVILAYSQRKGAYMDFKELEHNFGKITQDKPATYSFEFINTGDKPIIIHDVKTSCGCTTPHWTKRPVPPGAKGKITVEYQTLNSPGKFQKSIYVYSNAKNSPVKLTIKGEVLEKKNPIEELYPFKFAFGLRLTNKFVNIGVLFKDQKRTKTIKIYNSSSANITLKVAKDRLPNYIVAEVEPYSIPPKGTANLKITFDASKCNEWDFVRNRILFVINGKLYLRNWIDVNAVIREKFTEKQKKNPPIITFDKTEYNFGTIKQGDIINYEFKFKNTGKSPLIIRKVTTSCGCTTTFYTREPIKPGETGVIKVKFNSSGRLGRQYKTITVITNSPDPSSNRVILRLVGEIKSKN